MEASYIFSSSRRVLESTPVHGPNPCPTQSFGWVGSGTWNVSSDQYAVSAADPNETVKTIPYGDCESWQHHD